MHQLHFHFFNHLLTNSSTQIKQMANYHKTVKVKTPLANSILNSGHLYIYPKSSPRSPTSKITSSRLYLPINSLGRVTFSNLITSTKTELLMLSDLKTTLKFYTAWSRLQFTSWTEAVGLFTFSKQSNQTTNNSAQSVAKATAFALVHETAIRQHDLTP